MFAVTNSEQRMWLKKVKIIFFTVTNREQKGNNVITLEMTKEIKTKYVRC